MYMGRHLTLCFFAVSIFFFIICSIPNAPGTNPDSLQIGFFLPDNKITAFKNDSVTIGVTVNLPNLVKKLQVEHGDDRRIDTLNLTTPASIPDTVYFKTMYSTAGTKTFTVKALRTDSTTKDFPMQLIVAVPEMEIFFDSIPPAELLVFVNKSVSYRIVTHTDPQSVIYYTVKSNPMLDNSSVSVNGNTSGEILFHIDSAGTYRLDFIASNNVVSDSVSIRVRAVNAPELTKSSQESSLLPGMSDTLIFTGAPAETLALNDTGSFKSGEITVLSSQAKNVLKILFTPQESKTYKFPISISGRTSDGTTYNGIFIAEQIVSGDKPEEDMTDTSGPVIKLKSPASDSATVSSSSLSLEIDCIDTSGVDTVICKLGSAEMSVSKGTGDNYTIVLSGLVKGENAIIVTAKDKATKPNSTKVVFTIFYDPTMTDNVPPAVVLKNPQKQDQRLFTDTVTVQIECNDDNGISSVIATRAGKTLDVIEAGALYSVVVKGLNQGESDTVQFVVTDNSTAKVKKEYMVILRYNLKPSIISLVTPMDGEKAVIAKPSFSWSGGDDPDGDSVLYVIRYGKSQTSLDKTISGNSDKKVTPAAKLEPYTLYFWQVLAVTPVTGDSVSSDIWSFTTIEDSPVITVEPAEQKVVLGARGTFKVGASGDNLKYQWYKGDTVITGAISAEYTTPAVTVTTDGSVYSCVVSNGGGKATSASAKLTALYTVTYDINDGTGNVPVDINKYEKNESVTVMAGTGLTRTNFSFGGWGSDPSGNNTVYKANETIMISGGNLILYAVWNQLYAVTYNANSPSTGTAPASVMYTQGANVVIAGNTGGLMKSGNEFVGWNTNVSGSGVDYAAGQKIVMGAADIVLYAKWAPTYALTYNANEGGGESGHGNGVVPVDSKRYIADSTVKVLTNTGNLTRTGYVFDGWSLERNGPAVKSFKMGTNNDTLYARWVIKDIDGNEYTEISLGGRVWMVQNLRVTRLTDSTAIAVSTDYQKAAAYNTGDSIRGHNYNGYVILTGKLAPEGWHVATSNDWDTLNVLYSYTAKALASKDGWKVYSEDNNAIGYNNGLTNNSTGFTIVPGISGERAEFWIGNSIFEIDFNNVIGAIYMLTYDSQSLSYMGRMAAGEYHSIRCVRDY